MIRMVLLALGFLAITVTLLVVQPGAQRGAPLPSMAGPVTRAEPALDTALLPHGAVAVPASPAPSAPERASREMIVTPAPTQSALAAAPLDDAEMRRMTWETLSGLNRVTGQEAAPGQPGSLLHAIVRRSLDEAVPSSPGASTRNTYVVQQGDTLVSIAEQVYGDVNMTGLLFAANQGLLSRPDDLRPGQRLVLPAR